MIIGRTTELAVITDTISAISVSGSALVIDGEAGIGKSTLLTAAADWAGADGYTRLGCSGLQSQSEVGFAGVHELIHPLLAHAHDLPDRQRSALLTAFGLEDGPTPDRLLISLAVLGLLEDAATRRRLILVIDDVQWLDQSSLDVLAFVARRLANAPLLLLCAERTTMEGPVHQLEGLPRLSLGPLTTSDAEQLLTHTLRTSPRPVDPHLQQRVLEQANGNPLAVIELTSAIGERGTDATVFAGELLPTGRRVERAFLNQLDALASPARQLLLLITASDGSLTEIDTAAGLLGLTLTEHLDSLERATLITMRGGRIQVRHPLIRSTVYGAAPLSARARTHRALADAATDPVRAAWHRAEAAFGPDEQVAADLERAAEHARSRGAGAESAAALRRAAVLSTDIPSRVRRLSAAAEVARSAGLTREAISILSEAEPLADGHDDAQPLAITRFVLNATAALPGHTATDLVALAGKFADGEPQQRELLWAAAIECRMHGLADDARRDVAAAIAGLHGPDDDALLAVAAALVDDTGTGLAVRTQIPRLIDEFRDQPLLILALAFAAEAVAERTQALACWASVGHRSRHHGTPANECEGLRGSAQLLLIQGRPQAAAIAAQTALRMAGDMNLPMTVASSAAILARALTWQGQPERARGALDRARVALAPDPTILWNDDAHWAAGLAALCEANHAEALGHLLKMTLNRTSRRWAVADLAEAAAGCDQAQLVRPLVADIATQAQWLGSGFETMLAHRAQALLCDSEADAEVAFQAALAAGATADAELELARTHLLYGEWLRRRRRIVEARTHLSLALAAFDTAGAATFVERSAAELRAAGVSGASGSVKNDAAADLTAQELQIAQLAASGLTNREIGDRIYVSHKTVAAHLYKVFPKLGITSRSQLYAALGELVS
ncbi:AAA family ATPase [Mycolicibacterium mucogenicum]|uniref:helix-turn-helix transcriptional regulator n=1 Tax=Mycolicibacterium mucogenicum TaxID=56689 RepID=UPI00226A07BA|nr:LuxR family transcriptional regulator [Mycolicibacterium mucogenicum]MCX8564338.1 AAA family ATPase [Mycolicibacterium mucogenicum]